MKQILQDLDSGATQVAEVPAPQCKPGHVLIGSRRTLVSAGTERMLVEFGEAGYLEKARQQPERVKKVLDKIQTDGLWPTVEAVQAKLDRPMPLGYCQTGVVLETGEGVDHVAVGDRVVSNGHHAEVVSVPKHLVAPVPEGVSDDEAAFAVAGAIALQSIRLAEPTLGERFAVSGLGLVGLLTVQLLRAHGCEVVGIDMIEDRLELAESFGAETVHLGDGEDPVAAGKAFSGGHGVDGVIVAAATDSSEPIHQAAQMSRKRGRIVLVGVTGLELDRADFYEKELSFQVSCSYGPGRYDKNYEEQGLDYPIGFVRWTEQRNFEAVLQMMAEGKLDVEPLISERHSVSDAAEAYRSITGGGDAIGVLLDYPEAPQTTDETERRVSLADGIDLDPGRLFRTGKAKIRQIASEDVVVGAIGAGNYASRTLFPALESAGVRLKTVASSGGLSSHYAGGKFGFEEATTDVDGLLQDPGINTVIIATRHDTHAEFVCRALEQGKHVFVEKPLAIDRPGLERIEETYREVLESSGPSPLLMVGFNRRFAPHVEHIEDLLGRREEPPTFIMTVNAGEIPADHWTQDPKVGGGRIIGEGCHFIDLLRHLADAPIVDVQSTKMGSTPAVEVREDKMTIDLAFENGAIGSVHYFANGANSFPKERLEVFCGGGIVQLDNFRKLNGYDWPGFDSNRAWSQDKGNEACIQAFVRAIDRGEESPIPYGELVEVSRATFEAVEKA
jgi:predicted dehydrogenase/threonine dehydrogenase-like Zn-dependent dehydrogenase